jgi:hypothetical protein
MVPFYKLNLTTMSFRRFLLVQLNAGLVSARCHLQQLGRYCYFLIRLLTTVSTLRIVSTKLGYPFLVRLLLCECVVEFRVVLF